MKHLLTAGWLFYVTSGGVLSFTDEADHVPARYRAAAVEVEVGPLRCYRKVTTLVDPNAAPCPEERLALPR